MLNCVNWSRKLFGTSLQFFMIKQNTVLPEFYISFDNDESSLVAKW